MSEKLFTRMTATLSELKQNPMATVAAAEGLPIAIIHDNRPAFYCVPAKLYEKWMDALEDMELVAIVRDREGEETVDYDINR